MSAAGEGGPAPDAAGREFASDNHAGAHPEVLEAIAAANRGHADSYGADRWTERLSATLATHLGEPLAVYPVFNGTGANVLCLDLLCDRHEAVICTADAHINLDECGAPERIAGVKLLPIATDHGKLTAADVGRWEERRGDEHHVQPRVVSITQSTELGTVYSPEEVGAIAEAAHGLGMYVHVDGARIANAAVALDLPLAALTSEVGVDAISFGGTKNGLLFGELAVFCGAAATTVAPRAAYARKQLMQLASKMRFVSAQFDVLLGRDDLWLRNAGHANGMASLLAEGVAELDGAELVHPVEANGIFVQLPGPVIETLLEELPGTHPFYVWDEPEGIVRWMCSWDTTAEDVEALIAATRAALTR